MKVFINWHCEIQGCSEDPSQCDRQQRCILAWIKRYLETPQNDEIHEIVEEICSIDLLADDVSRRHKLVTDELAVEVPIVS